MMTSRMLPVCLAVMAALLFTGRPGLANPGVDPDLLAQMTAQLELSAHQKQKLAAIQSELQKQMARTRASIEIASIDLRSELGKDEPNESKVGSLVEAIAKLEGQARKARILAMLKIKRLLSDEQRAQLESGSSGAPKVAHRMSRRVGSRGHGSSSSNSNGNSKLDVNVDFDDDIDVDFDDAFEFEFEFDFDGSKLSDDERRRIKRDIARAKEHAKRARERAKRETRRALREAERARAEAMREAERAMKEAERQLREQQHNFTRIDRRGSHQAGPGKVTIASAPSAAIHIDGKKVGHTPLELELSPGRHVVEARWADGHKKMHLTVNQGDTINVVLRPPN